MLGSSERGVQVGLAGIGYKPGKVVSQRNREGPLIGPWAMPSKPDPRLPYSAGYPRGPVSFPYLGTEYPK
jgi:hypothetical protein